VCVCVGRQLVSVHGLGFSSCCNKKHTNPIESSGAFLGSRVPSIERTRERIPQQNVDSSPSFVLSLLRGGPAGEQPCLTMRGKALLSSLWFCLWRRQEECAFQVPGFSCNARWTA
jgi:hypothetical protein